MYSRKSAGPKIDHLGTPALTVYSCDDFLPEPPKAVYY